jgi:hypothetical protein
MLSENSEVHQKSHGALSFANDIFQPPSCDFAPASLVRLSILAFSGPTNLNQAAKMMNDSTEVPREFLLKQITNEINAAYDLVAAARKAFRTSRTEEGKSVLTQARRAMLQVSDSEVAHLRAITYQLRELNEAINWLLEQHAAGNK